MPAVGADLFVNGGRSGLALATFNDHNPYLLDFVFALYYTDEEMYVGNPTKEKTMEKYFDVLSRCPLFEEIDRKDYSVMLGCLGARVMGFGKHQQIFGEGEEAAYIGIVLSGAVQIVKEDYYGNRSIVDRMEPGELFGESFACVGSRFLSALWQRRVARSCCWAAAGSVPAAPRPAAFTVS
jgi:hypothetical protein